jgi:hypothetical protein
MIPLVPDQHPYGWGPGDFILGKNKVFCSHGFYLHQQVKIPTMGTRRLNCFKPIVNPLVCHQQKV